MGANRGAGVPVSLQLASGPNFDQGRPWSGLAPFSDSTRILHGDSSGSGATGNNRGEGVPVSLQLSSMQNFDRGRPWLGSALVSIVPASCNISSGEGLYGAGRGAGIPVSLQLTCTPNFLVTAGHGSTQFSNRLHPEMAFIREAVLGLIAGQVSPYLYS